MKTPALSIDRQADLWRLAAAVLGPEPPREARDISIARRRRRAFQANDTDPCAVVELRRDPDGSLHWIYSPSRVAGAGSGRRRGWRASVSAIDDVVKAFRFAALGTNRITEGLIDLDQRLTPNQGLKRWDVRRRELVALDATPLKGRTLLFVHGTFSKCQMFFDELGATASGRALLDGWSKGSRYAHILAFDHATLSVGAWSNGIDLAAALRTVAGPIDVICHSRGGLVVSWALRLTPLPIRKLVFVGSPLTGTSLAAPDRLRDALTRLANFADAAAAAGAALSSVVPFAAGAAGLAKVCGSALRLGDTPLVDAAVLLVPGLASQQRTQHSETQKLFGDHWLRVPQMFGIGCDFQPAEADEPLWKFWRRYTNIGDQVKNAAADFVFEQENDLVVDLAAMQQLGEASSGKPAAMQMTFKALSIDEGSRKTHHTNYFRNGTVVQTLESWLA
jgi:pimeloyl-ACP methyl ester carboxylesterase